MSELRKEILGLASVASFFPSRFARWTCAGLKQGGGAELLPRDRRRGEGTPAAAVAAAVVVQGNLVRATVQVL